MKEYTEDELREECKKALNAETEGIHKYLNAATNDEKKAVKKNLKRFIYQEFVVHPGVIKGTDTPSTEIVAEFVLNNLKQFEGNIIPITRETSYWTDTHTIENDHKNSHEEENITREEEHIALDMYKKNHDTPLDHIGRIIDYQTPLKNEQIDIAGKLDLLAYDNGRLTILELKDHDSTESMLRCVLEGYTYFLNLKNSEKFIDDFKKANKIDQNINCRITVSPFVYRFGNQFKEMQSPHPKLQKLMNTLNITPYYYDTDPAGAFDVLPKSNIDLDAVKKYICTL